MLEIEVPLGTTADDLLEQYGTLELLECLFCVECECGEWHALEQDGHCTCECGKRVESPMLAAGLI